MALPSLRNLQVFEVAARHPTLRATADALFLTHGAVSRQIRALEAELGRILGAPASVIAVTRGARRGRVSATARARMAAAQKARWAKHNGRPALRLGGRVRRRLSARARARLAAMARARWAKAKAAGKKTLAG